MPRLRLREPTLPMVATRLISPSAAVRTWGVCSSETPGLGGLPALQKCHFSLHTGRVHRQGCLFMSHATLSRQRDSLQELTLRGVGDGVRIHVVSPWLFGMTALRCLAVQNANLTALPWLGRVPCYTPRSLRTLDLDANVALQLDRTAMAALLGMSNLRQLSMRKRYRTSGGSPADGPGSQGLTDRDAKPPEATWSIDSVACIAQVAAARPTLQLCF